MIQVVLEYPPCYKAGPTNFGEDLSLHLIDSSSRSSRATRSPQSIKTQVTKKIPQTSKEVKPKTIKSTRNMVKTPLEIENEIVEGKL